MRQTVWSLILSLAALALPISAAGEAPVTALAFSPDGKAVVVGSQDGIDVRRWPSLEVVDQLNSVLLHVHDLAFSPAGDRLAAAGGAPGQFGGLELYSWPEAELLWEQVIHDDVVYGVNWSADGATLATAAGDHRVTSWSAADGDRRLDLVGHSRRVLALARVPTAGLVVSAGADQSLRVWNSQDGQPVRTLDNHTDVVRDLALRPGDHPLPMVASASADRTVRFWQPTIGRMVRFLRLPAEPLAIAWTSDGRHLGVVCMDGHIRLIDPETLEISLDEPVIEGWVYSIAMSSTTREAVVGGAGGVVRRIELP